MNINWDRMLTSLLLQKSGTVSSVKQGWSFMKTSEFIQGMAERCLKELLALDNLKDPEEGAQDIIEKNMLRLVLDLGTISHD